MVLSTTVAVVSNLILNNLAAVGIKCKIHFKLMLIWFSFEIAWLAFQPLKCNFISWKRRKMPKEIAILL